MAQENKQVQQWRSAKEPSGGWGRGLQRKSEKAQSVRESMLRLLATIQKKIEEKENSYSVELRKGGRLQGHVMPVLTETSGKNKYYLIKGIIIPPISLAGLQLLWGVNSCPGD